MKIILTLILCVLAASCHAQSLLTTPVESTEDRVARETIQNIQGTKTSIIGALRHSVSTLFDSQNPQGALDKLGPKASEVFALNEALTQFVVGLLTQAGDTKGLAEVQGIVARIPAHTINPDRTVTLTPEPTPTPAP